MRILVVEDEMTVALMIEDLLVELGHEVAEVAMRLSPALEAADRAEIDMALLDVNLAGQMSYPVAEVLGRRGIPYAFATGYGSAGIDPAFASRPTLHKPFRRADLVEIIARVAGQGAGPDPRES